MSFNAFGNDFLQELVPALQADRYLTGIDFTGCAFTAGGRDVLKHRDFEDFFDLDEEIDEIFVPDGVYLPISICLNLYMVEQRRSALNPFESFIL